MRRNGDSTAGFSEKKLRCAPAVSALCRPARRGESTKNRKNLCTSYPANGIASAEFPDQMLQAIARIRNLSFNRRRDAKKQPGSLCGGRAVPAG